MFPICSYLFLIFLFSFSCTGLFLHNTWHLLLINTPPGFFAQFCWPGFWPGFWSGFWEIWENTVLLLEGRKSDSIAFFVLMSSDEFWRVFFPGAPVYSRWFVRGYQCMVFKVYKVLRSILHVWKLIFAFLGCPVEHFGRNLEEIKPKRSRTSLSTPEP